MQNGTLEDKLVKIFNQESMIYLTPNETIKGIINNILYFRITRQRIQKRGQRIGKLNSL